YIPLPFLPYLTDGDKISYLRPKTPVNSGRGPGHFKPLPGERTTSNSTKPNRSSADSSRSSDEGGRRTGPPVCLLSCRHLRNVAWPADERPYQTRLRSGRDAF